MKPDRESVVELLDAEVRVPIGDVARPILGPLSLRIDSGEHWAVVGPNGSGKTTLLTVLAAQRLPFAGTVRVLGAPFGRVDMRPLRERIGIVSHAVLDRIRPETSVFDAVLAGRHATTVTWWHEFTAGDRDRALLLLERFGIGALASQPFSLCSQGERQRVAIARALMADPELLLYDEPAAGLDLPAREAVISSMETAMGEAGGPTTVLVTHYLEEIPPSVTHVLLLRSGVAIAAGPIRQVMTEAALSECFGMPIDLVESRGRWYAHAR